MNWLKLANEPQLWHMNMDDYVGPMYSDMSDEDWKERYRRKDIWTKSMQDALSHGWITPEKADERGLYGAKYIKPMPPVLYHVTTAKDKVLNEGLKTRAELSNTAGLGGGPEDTISLTENVEIAKAIENAILEARRLMTKEIDIHSMISMAESGEGASRPWISEWYSGHGSKDGAMPDLIKSIINGEDELVFNMPVTEGMLEMRSNGETYVPDPTSETDINSYNGSTMYSRWVRKLSPEEIDEKLMSAYKYWSAYRENAGGPMDPLFWGDSMNNLKDIPINQIATIEVKAKPGAQGSQQSALGEWRSFTGDVLSVVGVV